MKASFDENLLKMKPEKYHIIIGNRNIDVINEFIELTKESNFFIESYSLGKELLEAVLNSQPNMVILDVDCILFCPQ